MSLIERSVEAYEAVGSPRARRNTDALDTLNRRVAIQPSKRFEAIPPLPVSYVTMP